MRVDVMEKEKQIEVVMLITDDDGDSTDDKRWHLVMNLGEAPRIVCNGHVVGFGETSGITKHKKFKKGSITCNDCKEVINWFKSIQL